MTQRVQKVLAAAGVGSRRECEQLIAEGRVAVDGEVVTLGSKADARTQVLTVDGERIPIHPGLVHTLLNKPRGVVTTVSDPEGRPTVMELVPDRPRTFPVGRLDQDTEGLLLLTNDGELANRLTHPRYQKEKIYEVTLDKPLATADKAKLEKGVMLEDGLSRFCVDARLPMPDARLETKPADVRHRKSEIYLVRMHEGRNRQIRRTFAALGYTVTMLHRRQFGAYKLGDLPAGSCKKI